MTTRQPRGYKGVDHTTIGSDIVAVLKVITMPDLVLGAELHKKLKSVQPDAWYPIAYILEPMEILGRTVGTLSLTQMGRQLFRNTHAEGVKKMAKSAGDIIFALDDMYHNANRGQDIGGWKVMQFSAGKAVVENNTPHHCAMEEGILGEALATIGVPSFVQQTACFREGAETCLFQLTSAISDQRWFGGRKTFP